jgi:hypothetical protein
MSETTDKKRKIGSDGVVDDAKTHLSFGRKWRVITDEYPSFHGIAIEEDEETGKVISLHSRTRLDRDRWEDNNMPSFAIFPDLRRLELFKCRYLLHINDSLSELNQLRVLKIVGCSRLQTIPESIGQLNQLEEVCESFGPIWIRSYEN